MFFACPTLTGNFSSSSHFSFNTALRYLNDVTLYIRSPPIYSSASGCVSLLTAMNSVFFTFMTSRIAFQHHLSYLLDSVDLQYCLRWVQCHQRILGYWCNFHLHWFLSVFLLMPYGILSLYAGWTALVIICTPVTRPYALETYLT